MLLTYSFSRGKDAPVPTYHVRGFLCLIERVGLAGDAVHVWPVRGDVQGTDLRRAYGL